MAYDGLNILGQVPWKINKTILKVALHCWNAQIPVGDIPSFADHELPEEPVNPKKSDETFDASKYTEYRDAIRKYKKINQKNMDLKSIRCSAILKLKQAQDFQDYERIYFPYNMDFRGRAYPIPPHLSTVGSDLCRGLLTFATAKRLGPKGLFWIKVHLANLAGHDKVTFEERAHFTDQNMENIRAAVEDPFGENRWWMDLEEPFQALATCHEIINAIDSGDPESYECSLPIHMDGSCNGLQHYAALGRDPAGGRAVNLCKEDRPQDVYTGVMQEVIRIVQADAADLDFDVTDENLSKAETERIQNHERAKLVNGLIDRSVVKRTVMTSVYGVTFIGARKQINDKIEEKLKDKGVDVDEIETEIFHACGYLAKVTIQVMGTLFTGARQTMNWLTTCARLISKYGQPVSFVSPIGIPVIQPYRQPKSHLVATLMQVVLLANQSDDLPVHKQRQASAFPPNFVHSLDASHMILTALEMDRRGLFFAAVHDSFWTHACDINEMNVTLRDCFVQLYDQPLLENVKAQWEIQYPNINFPDLPTRGDLDLEEVRSAPYFFQ
jgi:DNA-directed RNA polymerase, mitochondrial